MFVQIIEGETSDSDGLLRQTERWMVELRPGTRGFIGCTSGITADGEAIALVRFASEADARANSERVEQGSWWAETEKYYDGDVTFSESTDVTEWLAGGSNTAGFVQVMKSTGADRAAIERLDETMGQIAETRPDLIGGYRVWLGPDRCVEVVYFSTEAEARAGEQAEVSVELAEIMDGMHAAMGEVRYLDLTSPRLD